MSWHSRVAMVLAVWSIVDPAVLGQGQPVRSKPKVELRWVETKRVNGLTEDKGFQSSDDPKDVVYPHKMPALILSATDVSEVRLTKLDLRKNGLGVQYKVIFDLKNEAREKLAATVAGKQMRLLTVVVDGRFWGVRRYEKDTDKKFIPDDARAETFLLDVGYFSSEAEAQRLVDAFK